jgi:hypothetical protein
MFSDVLGNVISELNTTIASLPTDEAEIAKLAEDRLSKATVVPWLERIELLDKEIDEREEYNKKLESGEIQGQKRATYSLKKERDALQRSVEQLEGGAYSSKYKKDKKTGEWVLTGGEKLIQDREELAKSI